MYDSLSCIRTVLPTGMEIYPLGSSFLEAIPQPLLAGLLAGLCFLVVAIVLSLMTACYMNHRREQRIAKRRQCNIHFHLWFEESFLDLVDMCISFGLC